MQIATLTRSLFAQSQKEKSLIILNMVANTKGVSLVIT